MNELRKSPIQYIAAFFLEAVLAAVVFYLFSETAEDSVSQIAVQPPYTPADWQNYFILVLTITALIGYGIAFVWFTVTNQESILLELHKARVLFGTLLVSELVLAVIFFIACWIGATVHFGVAELALEHYLFFAVSALVLTVVFFFVCVKLMSSTNVKGTV